ncbi:MAG: pyridoxamine 5'-phosphate oxidase family protein [Chitinophagaceae bacterium]|jgi:nitroimidazol reductase NimA-like FMN-containing flavoprotein (pyridoxamine 5'-phosphate oxidase superfamily)
MLGHLNKEEIEEVLTNGIVGRIGYSLKGKTYIVPINYVYDGRQVIAHSTEGNKIFMMRQNPQVCFEVEEIVNNQNWKSVIAQGTFHEITDERERYEAMKLFVDKMMKLKVSTTAHPPENNPERVRTNQHSAKAVIYRIILTEKTGRYEKEMH